VCTVRDGIVNRYHYLIAKKTITKLATHTIIDMIVKDCIKNRWSTAGALCLAPEPNWQGRYARFPRRKRARRPN